MNKDIKSPSKEFNSGKKSRVFARNIAYQLTTEQAKQVSGGKRRCRRTPDRGDFECDLY